MNYKGPVVLVSSRCLNLSWQNCLCLDNNENEQTSEGIRRRKPLSTRTINQLFLLLCTLVWHAKSIAGFVWDWRQWRDVCISAPAIARGCRRRQRWDAWGGRGQHQSLYSQNTLSINDNHHSGYTLSSPQLLMNEIALVRIAAC